MNSRKKNTLKSNRCYGWIYTHQHLFQIKWKMFLFLLVLFCLYTLLESLVANFCNNEILSVVRLFVHSFRCCFFFWCVNCFNTRSNCSRISNFFRTISASCRNAIVFNSNNKYSNIIFFILFTDDTLFRTES